MVMVLWASKFGIGKKLSVASKCASKKNFGDTSYFAVDGTG